MPVVGVQRTTDKISRLVPYFENGTLRIGQTYEDLIPEYLDSRKIKTTIFLMHWTRVQSSSKLPRPVIAIFGLPSTYQSIEREDDRIRIMRDMRP